MCAAIEGLSVWITGVLQRFLGYSFDFSSVKHSDTVYKVTEYIRRSYFRKISLDDIARHVHFSKTYLSRIFEEETSETSRHISTRSGSTAPSCCRTRSSLW